MKRWHDTSPAISLRVSAGKVVAMISLTDPEHDLWNGWVCRRRQMRQPVYFDGVLGRSAAKQRARRELRCVRRNFSLYLANVRSRRHP